MWTEDVAIERVQILAVSFRMSEWPKSKKFMLFMDATLMLALWTILSIL